MTVKDLANEFLNAKQALVDAGELSPRTWGDYKTACDRNCGWPVRASQRWSPTSCPTTSPPAEPDGEEVGAAPAGQDDPVRPLRCSSTLSTLS